MRADCEATDHDKVDACLLESLQEPPGVEGRDCGQVCAERRAAPRTASFVSSRLSTIACSTRCPALSSLYSRRAIARSTLPSGVQLPVRLVELMPKRYMASKRLPLTVRWHETASARARSRRSPSRLRPARRPLRALPFQEAPRRITNLPPGSSSVTTKSPWRSPLTVMWAISLIAAFLPTKALRGSARGRLPRPGGLPAPSPPPASPPPPPRSTPPARHAPHMRSCPATATTCPGSTTQPPGLLAWAMPSFLRNGEQAARRIGCIADIWASPQCLSGLCRGHSSPGRHTLAGRNGAYRARRASLSVGIIPKIENS